MEVYSYILSILQDFYKFECAFETHSVMLFSKLYHNSYNSSFKILFTIPGFALPFIAFIV